VQINSGNFRNLVLAFHSLHCCSQERVEFIAITVIDTSSGAACETNLQWRFYLRQVVSWLHCFYYLHIWKEVSVNYLRFLRNKNLVENLLKASHAVVKLQLAVDSEQFQIEVTFTVWLASQRILRIGKILTQNFMCFGGQNDATIM